MGGKSVPKHVRTAVSVPEDIPSEEEYDDNEDNQSVGSHDSTMGIAGGDGLTQGPGLNDVIHDGDDFALTAADEEFVPMQVPGQQYSVADIPKFVKHTDLKIRVKNLVWDLEGKHGQIRRLNNQLVRKYYNMLKTGGLPRNFVRVLVKELDGMYADSALIRSMYACTLP
jgi:hypothetical protein